MYDITHATPELFAALALAQGEIENANKNAANHHFRSKYADLAEVLNTIRPVFAKHGLSLIQSPGYDGSMASVTTVLAHQSGGYMTSTASCVPAKADAHPLVHSEKLRQLRCNILTEFVRVVVRNSTSEAHVVAVAVGPTSAVARASGTLLECEGVDRHAAPLALGDDEETFADLAVATGRAQHLLRFVHRNDSVWEDGACLSEGGVVRSKSHCSPLNR